MAKILTYSRRLSFWRVILDEAQSIRVRISEIYKFSSDRFIQNPSTRVSSAVTHLLAEHRWCLTGTPIVNTLKDAFGLLRFLRHQPFGVRKCHLPESPSDSDSRNGTTSTITSLNTKAENV